MVQTLEPSHFRHFIPELVSGHYVLPRIAKNLVRINKYPGIHGTVLHAKSFFSCGVSSLLATGIHPVTEQKLGILSDLQRLSLLTSSAMTKG
jgi:hypothetical protein